MVAPSQLRFMPPKKIRIDGAHRRVVTVVQRTTQGTERRYDLKADAARALADGRTGELTAAAFLEHHALRVDIGPAETPTTGEVWPHAFSIGDQVRLKSGGHRMVVTGLRCSEATCADPYRGKLETVSVAWSQQSQMEGDDIAEEDLDPAVIEIAVLLPHKRIPF